MSVSALENFQARATELAEISHSFYARGWVLGTSGNFSAVLNREPLRLAISPSGVDKGALTAAQILLIDERAEVVSDHQVKPSDETPLHLMLVSKRAGAVLHTHSVWSTILSELHATEGGLAIEGYEMVKGLQGVTTHQHREWLPIFENSQDMNALAENVSARLDEHPNPHGFMLRGHGLYSWASDLRQAKRHIEILEFLLEAAGRTRQLSSSNQRGV